jgi:hypothetical protein
MIASPLFIRVVPTPRNHEFTLLIGWDSKLVHDTAMYVSSLTGLQNRDQLNAAIARAIGSHAHSEVRDLTAEGIQARLRKLFNEPSVKEAA